jgi:hypothetical protein
LSSKDILDYVKAKPFRPFRVVMNSGRSFDIRHPEMVRVGRDYFILFSTASDNPDLVDRWETISLLLVESLSHLDAQAV